MKTDMIFEFGVLGSISISGLVLAWIIFNAGHPNPNVDYHEQLNAGIAEISEDDKAWNVYRDAWAQFEICEGSNGQFKEIFVDDETGHRLIIPTDPGWSVGIKKLQESEPLLESFRKARLCSRLGLALQSDINNYSREDRAALFPDSPADRVADIRLGLAGIEAEVEGLMAGALISTLMPHISTFRQAARILIVDSRRAIEEGKTERVVQNIEAVLAIAKHTADSQVLIAGIGGVVVAKMGFDLIDEMLTGNPDRFDEGQLERIQKSVRQVSPKEMIQLSGERLLVLDLIQRTFTNNGLGNGRITKPGLQIIGISEALAGFSMPAAFSSINISHQVGGPLAMFTMASRRETVAKLNDWMARAEQRFQKPIWDQPDFKELEDEIQEQAMRYPLLALTIPSVQSIYFIGEQAQMDRDATLLALAAYRFRLRHGNWPQSANNLKPDFVETIPLDRVDQMPLRYRLASDGFQIYSVGNDGVDNGGIRGRVGEDGTIALPKSNDADPNGVPKTELRPLPSTEYRFLGEPCEGTDFVIWPRKSEF